MGTQRPDRVSILMRVQTRLFRSGAIDLIDNSRAEHGFQVFTYFGHNCIARNASAQAGSRLTLGATSAGTSAAGCSIANVGDKVSGVAVAVDVDVDVDGGTGMGSGSGTIVSNASLSLDRAAAWAALRIASAASANACARACGSAGVAVIALRSSMRRPMAMAVSMTSSHRPSRIARSIQRDGLACCQLPAAVGFGNKCCASPSLRGTGACGGGSCHCRGNGVALSGKA